MPKIIQYAVLDDVEQTIVVTKDGGITTTHYNEEFIAVDFYINKIPRNFKSDNEIWNYLDDGGRYWRDWEEKRELDEEVILSMARWLYEQSDLIVIDADKVLYVQDKNVNCFCNDDIKAFLGKNYFENGNN
jgi:hypothetical protein